IKLKPGESTRVSFTITPAMMAVINEKGEPVINPGTYKFYIAGAVPIPRSETLGISKPASAECVVK
ncbi:MAG TPA: fibronectin type III-like domain-contianing protein, partial [Chitinophagaceae bacterium]